MKYDFDTEIPREGTDSVKWEFAQVGEDMLHFERTDRFFGEDRALPMWVADMDFRCPEPVVRALRERAEHGIFGYTAPMESFFDAVVGWMRRRHGWEIEPGWICVSPGVVVALNLLVRTFIEAGEKVLIQPPVYYPFFMAAENNEAVIAPNPLVLSDGKYSMDFEQLERQLADPAVKMAILCNPHNPGGRVWTREELLRFGDACNRHDVLVVSDEIHGDLTLDANVFTPYASLGAEYARHSVTCTAPSKTFNLAGLQTSCVIVPDDDLRAKFQQALLSTGLFGVGSFGAVALEAAYNDGEEWLEQVKAYITANLDYLEDYVREHFPEISVMRPEGTYLVWLDCRALGLEDMELRRLMMEGARVYLDDGIIFGDEGAGFERINIACPRHILVEALERIRVAIATR